MTDPITTDGPSQDLLAQQSAQRAMNIDSAKVQNVAQKTPEISCEAFGATSSKAEDVSSGVKSAIPGPTNEVVTPPTSAPIEESAKHSKTILITVIAVCSAVLVASLIVICFVIYQYKHQDNKSLSSRSESKNPLLQSESKESSDNETKTSATLNDAQAKQNNKNAVEL